MLKNKSGFAAIFIILTGVIFSVVVYFILQNFRNQQVSQKQPLPSAPPAPSSTPLPEEVLKTQVDTSNWKSYSSGKFSLKYPSSLTLENYQNTESIKISDLTKGTFTVFVQGKTGFESAYASIQDDIERCKNLGCGGGATPVILEKIKINDVEFIKTKENVEGPLGHVIAFYTIHDGEQYEIQFAFESETAEKENVGQTFYQILSTFKFIP